MKIFNVTTIYKIAFAVILTFAVALSSCKKDDESDSLDLVPGPTSIRLIHSSLFSKPTAVDLYVDGVKVNASGSVTFPEASTYFPITSGVKNIEVRGIAGGSLDTVITVRDNYQYSIYLKELQKEIPSVANPNPELIRAIVPVLDNNTSAPAEGKAKLRFVNMSSAPLNTTASMATLLRLIGPTNSYNPDPSRIITQTLLSGKSSDFFQLDAGPVSLRANGHLTSIAYDPNISVDFKTTLKSGKLYTLYLVSTGDPKTTLRSPIALKLIENK